MLLSQAPHAPHALHLSGHGNNGASVSGGHSHGLHGGHQSPGPAGPGQQVQLWTTADGNLAAHGHMSYNTLTGTLSPSSLQQITASVTANDNGSVGSGHGAGHAGGLDGTGGHRSNGFNSNPFGGTGGPVAGGHYMRPDWAVNAIYDSGAGGGGGGSSGANYGQLALDHRRLSPNDQRVVGVGGSSSVGLVAHLGKCGAQCAVAPQGVGNGVGLSGGLRLCMSV